MAGRISMMLLVVAALLALIAAPARAQQVDSAVAVPNIITAEEQMQRSEDMAAKRKLLGYRPIPIDVSVVLLFMSDVEGGENSPCVQMLKRALEFKGRAIK
jgi:parvulin-like peptidyl-prolyl isomerase